MASRTGALAAALFLVAAGGASAQDNTPPGPASATVYHKVVLHLYTDEALVQTSLPDPSAFTVKIGGGTARAAGKVRFCAQNCIAIQIHLLQTIDPGDTVTVSYTKPATNPLKDAAGNETLSFTAFSVDNPLTATLPKVPTLSTGGIGSVTLEWDAASGTPPVTKYQVGYYRVSSLEVVWEDVPGGAAARTYTVTGLREGLLYQFFTRAVNNDGFGPSSLKLQETRALKVETPSGFTATGGFRKLDLSWTAAASTVNVERYQYRLSTDGGDNWNLWNDIPGSDSTTVSYTVSSLPDATNYTVELRMRAGSLRSGAATATARTANVPGGFTGPPGAPTNLTRTLLDGCFVTMDWSAPASNGGSAITRYQIRHRVGNGSFSSWQQDLGNPLTTGLSGFFTCGVAHNYQFRAANANGPGPSAEITFVPVQTERPVAPVNLAAVGGFRRVALSWETAAGHLQPYRSLPGALSIGFAVHPLGDDSKQQLPDHQPHADRAGGRDPLRHPGAGREFRGWRRVCPAEGDNAGPARGRPEWLHGDGGHPQGGSGVDGGGLDRGRGGVPVPAEHRRRRHLERLDRHCRKRRDDHPPHREPPRQRDRLHGRAADPGRYVALRGGEPERDDAGRAVRAGALREARRPVDHADVEDAGQPRPGNHEVPVPAHESQPRFHRLVQYPGQRADHDELHAQQRALGCGEEIHLRGARGERGGQRPRGERRRHDGGVG